MKDAIGGSLLLNLVVIFTSIIILFFAGILAYSKAYKVKNKIIEIIEGHNGQITDIANSNLIDAGVLDEITTELTETGYFVSSASIDERNARCERDTSRDHCTNLNTSNFNYCICEQSSAIDAGKSYEVITYVHFSFPVIGDLLTFPVKGETRVLGKEYHY